MADTKTKIGTSPVSLSRLKALISDELKVIVEKRFEIELGEINERIDKIPLTQKAMDKMLKHFIIPAVIDRVSQEMVEPMARIAELESDFKRLERREIRELLGLEGTAKEKPVTVEWSNVKEIISVMPILNAMGYEIRKKGE